MNEEQINKIIEKSRQKIAISHFKMEENMSKKKINKSIFSSIVVACFILAIITGGVFAKDISEFVKGLFGPNASEGVDTAIDNGYVAEVNTEYQNSNGIEINIESFLLDNYNFDMIFNIKLTDENLIEEFKEAELKEYGTRIDFDDLIISNENGENVFDTARVILEGKTEREVKEFYKGKEPYMGGYSLYGERISDSEFKMTLTATGNSTRFPKSKKLIINLTQIENWKWINRETDNLEKKSKYYEGNWHFELDVPKEMYNSEEIDYKAISCTENSIELNNITATLSKTAFKINIPKIKTEKVDYEKIHNFDGRGSIYDAIALQKEYVETSKGKKFEPARRSDGDGGYGLPADEPETIIDYHQTFNLTEHNATDSVTVHIFTNKDEEIIIEFEKE